VFRLVADRFLSPSGYRQLEQRLAVASTERVIRANHPSTSGQLQTELEADGGVAGVANLHAVHIVQPPVPPGCYPGQQRQLRNVCARDPATFPYRPNLHGSQAGVADDLLGANRIRTAPLFRTRDSFFGKGSRHASARLSEFDPFGHS
jgi:hypothetical protein